MEPNNNDNKKKIIIALCCIFAIALLTIPFLEKDNQIPKTNKEEILNNTNKISSKKTFLFFIIIGIAVVIILIISLIILFIKRHNANKNKIDNNANNLEDFLSRRCYFFLYNAEIIISFGDKNIDYISSKTLFINDISSKAKQQFNFYKTLANDQNLKNSLITFYELAVNFFFEIDGHLLRAHYNNNKNTPLGQMSKNFNGETFFNQTIYDDIFKFYKTDATRPLSDEEKKLLNDSNYVNLFKIIMQQDTIPYYEEENKQLPLFEHCHAVYMQIKAIYEELTDFFNEERNEEHSNKYKTKIDNAMNEINNFLKIQPENNQPPA